MIHTSEDPTCLSFLSNKSVNKINIKYRCTKKSYAEVLSDIKETKKYVGSPNRNEENIQATNAASSNSKIAKSTNKTLQSHQTLQTYNHNYISPNRRHWGLLHLLTLFTHHHLYTHHHISWHFPFHWWLRTPNLYTNQNMNKQGTTTR